MIEIQLINESYARCDGRRAFFSSRLRMKRIYIGLVWKRNASASTRIIAVRRFRLLLVATSLTARTGFSAAAIDTGLLCGLKI